MASVQHAPSLRQTAWHAGSARRTGTVRLSSCDGQSQLRAWYCRRHAAGVVCCSSRLLHYASNIYALAKGRPHLSSAGRILGPRNAPATHRTVGRKVAGVLAGRATGQVVLIVLSCCAVGLDNTIHTPITVLHSLQELQFMLHNLHSDTNAAAER